MKNNKENKFKTFIKTHRVFSLTVFLFLIVVPLILIPTVYIYQVASSKHVLFEDKSIKAVKLANQDYFDIEVTLYNIKEPLGDSMGQYIFNYKITTKDTVNSISDIAFTGQLSVVNDKYTSFSGDFLTTLESSSTTRLIFDWDYNMNKTILPFLKPKGPKLYLQIDFIYEMAEPLHGAPEEKTIFIEVPFN